MDTEKMTIVVTGASGMIGEYVVKGILNAGNKVLGLDIADARVNHTNYIHEKINLNNVEKIDELCKKYKPDRVVHLAALAHTNGQSDLSYEKYYNINVECAKNIFTCAAKRNVPVLFISTVDVYGFCYEAVDYKTVPNPVTVYGKTKYLAEQELEKICSKYDSKFSIFRFSPVYTDTVKRDIQKRYYLKYSAIMYLVGKGLEYEVLNVNNAVLEIVNWLKLNPDNEIRIIKDKNTLKTAECVKREKDLGNAKIVIHLPKCLVNFVINLIIKLFGKNKYTYLLNKVSNPLKSK